MEGASQKAEQKKPPTALKRVSSVKSESETQTSVAVRVPSLKVKAPIGEPKSLENMVTEEQLHNASMARKRRMMAKKTQGVRTREKTPEPSRTIAPHEDTTTTDEEDQKEPKPHHEYEEEDSYLLMKKKIEEKNSQKDADDLDIDAIREAQVEQARERRRRSISPFALPSKEEIEGLQRKGSFIDPGNKLLTTPPSYPLTCKDEFDPSIRRNSLIFEESPRRESLTVPPPSPNSPKNKTAYQLSTPPVPRKGPESVQETEKTSALPSNARNETNQTKTQKSMLNKLDPITIKPKQPSLMSYTNVNVAKPKEIQLPQNNQYPSEEPPVRPKRSKSGTRSQGRTSESEMSEDQSTSRVQHQPQPQKAPKPKERRRTIAAIKRSVRERSPAVRSKSATRPEKPLDISGIEITKTSAGIIDLLQKEARRKSMPLAEDVQKAASATKSTVDNTRQLMTPKRTLSPKRSKRGISCPKTIKILTKEETMESFIQAQRKSVEIERSRRSSGYVDASQSEITSSCYSSSYSEDESDFDLSKKSAELTKKLRLLQSEKEKEIKSTEAKKDKQDSEDKEKQVKSGVENVKKDKDKPETEKIKVDKSKKEKAKVENVEIVKEEIIIPDNAGKIEKAKLMYKIIRIEWKKFVVDFDSDYQKIKLLRNTCFSDLVILIILCGLGGIVFRYTEGAFENFYKCGVKRVKRDFIDSLWQGSHNMREEDWKSTARRKLWDFETQLHTAHEAGVHSYSGQKSWSFMNSMVYCLTVVTTIGYGHIAPSTSTGRALTIVYAIIGIPLFLILLADFGKLFTRGIKFLWAFVRRVYYTGSCRKVRKTVPMQEMMRGFNMVYEAASTLRRPSQMNGDEETGVPPALPPKPNQSTKPNLLGLPNTDKTDDTILEDLETQTPAPSVFEIDDEFNLPISVAIVSLIIYIFLGASVYVVWEEWDFFESFYFVFISMSTIGFGDYVPKHPMYMMCSIVYLVFGMSLTSMCINVVQVKLSDSFRQASAKIGATIGLRVSEEDGSLAPVTPPPVEIPAIHGGNQGSENIEPVKV